MNCEQQKRRVVVGISGASGIIYAVHLLKILLESDAEVFYIPTAAALRILYDETGLDNFGDAVLSIAKNNDDILKNLKLCDIADFYAPPASGSFRFDAMAVLPCSMNTLGKIAHSIADNLLIRAADVALKERRKFVICPRETPLAYTHIENMRILSLAGAVIMPAAPSFYTKPKTIDELAKFFSARVAQTMGFSQNNIKEWGL